MSMASHAEGVVWGFYLLCMACHITLSPRRMLNSQKALCGHEECKQMIFPKNTSLPTFTNICSPHIIAKNDISKGKHYLHFQLCGLFYVTPLTNSIPKVSTAWDTSLICFSVKGSVWTSSAPPPPSTPSLSVSNPSSGKSSLGWASRSPDLQFKESLWILKMHAKYVTILLGWPPCNCWQGPSLSSGAWAGVSLIDWDFYMYN